jgi:hypothetical protein
MTTAYRVFSLEGGPSLTPDVLGTGTPPVGIAPTIKIALDHDPLKGGVILTHPAGRGGVIRTGGGVVYHDFGVVEGDGMLYIAGNVVDGEWLKPATVVALKAAEAVVNAEYYFTDGISCWKVRWSRNPRGFQAWYDARWARLGRIEYSYEINFIVVEKAI